MPGEESLFARVRVERLAQGVPKPRVPRPLDVRSERDCVNRGQESPPVQRVSRAVTEDLPAELAAAATARWNRLSSRLNSGAAVPLGPSAPGAIGTAKGATVLAQTTGST